MPETSEDKTMLRIQIKAEMPLFGTTITAIKSYKYNEIVCGKYFEIELESGERHWENWGKIRKPSLKDFENCRFKKNCGIFRDYKTTHIQDNENEILNPWTRFRQR